MKPNWYRFGLVVSHLNYVPRYGRMYRLTQLDVASGDRRARFKREIHWAWQWRGHWGDVLLMRIGMYWDFLDESTLRGEDAVDSESIFSPQIPDVELRKVRNERRLTVLVVVLALLSAMCLIFGTLAS